MDYLEFKRMSLEEFTRAPRLEDELSIEISGSDEEIVFKVVLPDKSIQGGEFHKLKKFLDIVDSHDRLEDELKREGNYSFYGVQRYILKRMMMAHFVENEASAMLHSLKSDLDDGQKN